MLTSADDKRIAFVDLDLQSNCGPRISSFLKNYLIQSVPGGKVSIMGGHSIGHSKQKNIYVHVSHSEWFPR
jgi:hypothetical protein